ncbi:MAG: alpha/beta fold hydrolase [Lewinellaceae bacterium]|nr:alpha/beta fold hydrolase [Lewinellaceae bacterium]
MYLRSDCRGFLAAADYVVVLFDYPGFGESEGLPQQEVNPDLQIETYRAAFDFLSSQQAVDTNRIGLWGGSYSGSHALVAASLENRVRCVGCHDTPFVSGSAHWQNLPDKMRIRLSALF